MKGYRKYSLAVASLIASVALCAAHRMSGMEFVSAIGVILGSHFASNVISTKFGGLG